MNTKLRHIVVSALASASLLAFTVNAMADTTDDIVNALVAKGVLTEEEGALLMKGRTGEKEAAEKKKESSVSAKYKDGLSFESGDGKFKASINGRVHADYRFFDHNDSDSNSTLPPASITNSIANTNSVADTFDMRRARLGFKAAWKDYYEAEVVADLGNTTTLDVGYLNVAWWKPVQFRFGQFKMPMNLEELTSSNNIDFMERSYVNALAPAKEIGVMVHGTPFKGVTYALAASNGNAKNAETDIREDGKDVIGRVTANFAEMMDNKEMVLHAGASFSQGDLPQGTVGANGRTEARGATFYTSPVLGNAAFSNIDRSRLGLEGAVAYGPFKVQAEWMQLNNDFKTLVRSYDLDTENWYAEALWTITGEAYADAYKGGVFGGLKPKTDFDPAIFKGGLWEVGARYSEFDASDYNAVGIAQGTVDAGITTKAKGFAKAEAWTLGLKFLPTSNMRFMLNYVDTDFSDVIGGATGGVVVNQKRIDDEKAVVMRAQWMF
ncbi:MAG TPA: porin [Methylotenera sp.]|nr:porin [Methylotenera sp.]HPH05113.1 porin [Methylotenera sp.]HPN00477.1 porin [Methylotenera sp.]